MNRVFLSQWIELHRRFSWLVGTYEIWITALLVIKFWITHIWVFLINVFAFYRPSYAIKRETHDLTHWRFFVTTTKYDFTRTSHSAVETSLIKYVNKSHYPYFLITSSLSRKNLLCVEFCVIILLHEWVDRGQMH